MDDKQKVIDDLLAQALKAETENAALRRLTEVMYFDGCRLIDANAALKEQLFVLKLDYKELLHTVQDAKAKEIVDKILAEEKARDMGSYG